MAQSPGRKNKPGEEWSYTLIPLLVQRYSELQCSFQKDLYICISTVASLHRVESKTLHTLFYSLLLLAQVLVANHMLPETRPKDQSKKRKGNAKSTQICGRQQSHSYIILSRDNLFIHIKLCIISGTIYLFHVHSLGGTLPVWTLTGLLKGPFLNGPIL